MCLSFLLKIFENVVSIKCCITNNIDETELYDITRQKYNTKKLDLVALYLNV